MATTPDAAQARSTNTTDKVGLLFVHGIGEQKPFDNLREYVGQIAELMNRIDGALVTVTDLTAGWKVPVGEPTAGGVAPITLTMVCNGRTQIFECHEVYWADLGEPTGLGDTITFWVWALGQWCAPIYRDNDAAQLSKSDKGLNGATFARPISRLARLPRSVGGYLGQEMFARFCLMLAGLGALLTLASWSLLKRVASKLLQSAPSPSLLVGYVGKVRTYEERAHPGDTALSDPGFPRRVGIRRRMVTQMVAMGARQDLDRWYVLAHSLGSIVAYNGLAEIGHTLPNYLGGDQWTKLPKKFKRDSGCQKRPSDEIQFMMPARPDWLAYDDVINRPALFRKLAGFVTYGSPLDIFAAIWPRILATATDRTDPNLLFPAGCQWINLRAPLDPIGGPLKRFGAVNMIPAKAAGASPTPGKQAMAPMFQGYMLQPKTYTTPFCQVFLLAHLDYFQNSEPYSTCPGITQRESIVRWLFAGTQGAGPAYALKPMGRLQGLGYAVTVLFVLLVLLVMTTAIVVCAGGISLGLLTASGFAKDLAFWPVIHTIFHAIAWIFDMALAVILGAGLIRWVQESWFNWKLAMASNLPVPAISGMHQLISTEPDAKTGHIVITAPVKRVIGLPGWQMVGATATAMLTLVVAIAGGIYRNALPGVDIGPIRFNVPSLLVLAVILILIAAATFLQALINKRVPPLSP